MMQHNDYLVHHGIEGQKWGVTNGPPYPLNKSDYSSAERDALIAGSKERSTGSTNKPAATSSVTPHSKYGWTSAFESTETAVTRVNPHVRHFQSNCVATSLAVCARTTARLNVAAKDIDTVPMYEIHSVFPGIKFHWLERTGKRATHKEFDEAVDSTLRNNTKIGDVGLLYFDVKKNKDAGHMIAFKKTLGGIRYYDGQDHLELTENGKTVGWASGLWYDMKGNFKFGNEPQEYSPEYVKHITSIYDTQEFGFAVVSGHPITNDTKVLDKYFERGKR